MNYPAHLSYQELERYAFLAGDGLTASLAEEAHDLDQVNTRYAGDQERLKAEAFEAGKVEGLGQDVQAVITELKLQITNQQDQLRKATELLGTSHAWLAGNQVSTVKGRREAAHALANRMVAHGLSYPRH